MTDSTIPPADTPQGGAAAAPDERPASVWVARFRLTARPTPATLAGLITATALLLLLVARNRELLFSRQWEDGDFAVNSILIDQAQHFRLLVGNYSRVGFNHPGPALLYVQAWSEQLFRDGVPVFASPFGAHVFGILVLNSILIGMCSTIVVRRTGRIVAAVVLLACVLIYAWRNPGLIASTWMPHVYVWPFLLLVVSAASVASGEVRDTWKLMLANGLLVHGHVSFALFAAGFTVVAAIALTLQRSNIPARALRSACLSCGVVVAVFALPILVNTAFNYPGEIDDYINYSRSNQAGGHSLREALGFVRNYWAEGRNGDLLAFGLFVAACISVSRVRPRHGQQFMLGLLGMVVVATGLTTVYAARGVDDLSFRYIAIFYIMAPLLTLFAVGMGAVELFKSVRTKLAITTAFAVALAVIASQSDLKNPYPGAPWIPSAATHMTAGRTEPIHLRFDLRFWPQAAGLVQEARRRGVDVCVEELAPMYRTLFTDEVVCSLGDAGRGTSLELVDPLGATGQILYSNSQFALRAAVAAT